MVLMKASAVTGPTPGIVIKRMQTASCLAIACTFLCRRDDSSRSFRLAASSGAMIAARSGIPSTRSRITDRPRSIISSKRSTSLHAVEDEAQAEYPI